MTKELDSFLQEEDKKKKATKAKPKKKEQGADDKKYFKLMDEYKQKRRDPKNKKECSELMKKMAKLRLTGEVSPNAKLGAAYL